MIIKIWYIKRNIKFHVSDMSISMHKIEPKALKAPLAAAIRFMYDL